MCLACELDALWYAEWERLTGAGSAGAAGTAGVSPALSEDPADAEGGETKGAGETPAVPDGTASRTRFRCEETE
jgi:hypothetical protein